MAVNFDAPEEAEMQRVRTPLTDPELVRISLRQVERGTENAAVSADRLLKAGTEGLDAAIDHMRNITARLKRLERITSIVLVNGAIALGAVNVFSVVDAMCSGTAPIPPASMISVWLLYVAGLLVLPLNLISLSRKRNRVLDVVSQIDDVRVLGPVTELLERDRAAAGKALVLLLPRIKPEDRERLLPSQLSQLHQLLLTLRRDEKELGAAVVTALGKVGDSRSLVLLERIAESRSRKHIALREAALLALPPLRQYVDNMRLGKALLRPSQSPTNELLHPAAGGTDLGNNALLRPDNNER